MEIAIGDGIYDPVDDKWESEEHRLAYEEASKCPADVSPKQ